MGDDQPGVFLVVGGNNVPGRGARTGGLEALCIGFHVVVPRLALLDIGSTEFPVLVRIIDALDEALALFLARQMQEKLDDATTIAMQVALGVNDGAVAAFPELRVVKDRCLLLFKIEHI